MQEISTVGIIGAGLMGAGIGHSLINKGYQTFVCAHRNREPIEELVKAGAIETRDISALAKAVDCLLLCLPGAPEVESIISKIKPHCKNGMLIIDTTTSRPETTKTIATELAVKDIIFIDAPLTGGPKLAHEGKLISMVGASETDYSKALPVISAYSSRVEHMGPTTAGNRAKLINNLMTVGAGALVIEAYRKAREDGLDWQQLYGFMSEGFARSGMQDLLIKPEIDGVDSGYKFSLKNAAKDLNYIQNYLEQDNVPRPALRGLVEFYETAETANSDGAYVRDLLDKNRKLRPE